MSEKKTRVRVKTNPSKSKRVFWGDLGFRCQWKIRFVGMDP